MNVAAAQRRQLAPPEATERRQQDQRTIARTDGLSDRVNLGCSQHGPLWRFLLPSALDPARVATDHPILDSGVHHGLEQPVSLRHGDLADPGVKQLLAPA